MYLLPQSAFLLELYLQSIGDSGKFAGSGSFYLLASFFWPYEICLTVS